MSQNCSSVHFLTRSHDYYFQLDDTVVRMIMVFFSQKGVRGGWLTVTKLSSPAPIVRSACQSANRDIHLYNQRWN
jgi:hypothetical protein